MAEPEQCEVVVEPPETGEANAACQEEAEEADREFEPMSNGLPDVQIEDVGSERLGEIERDLDTLSFSGSTINELELQLMKQREVYRRTLATSQERLETLKRRLSTSIQKSEPFVEIWRRARQVQEASNRAAASYDKASSEHAAAREIVRMAEVELGKLSSSNGDSPTANIDPAWQETLNHATTRVVHTERERRLSEVEHRRVLDECTTVMDEYRATERRLRSHIIKSRPYFEERYRCNQQLQQMKRHIAGLEKRVADSKHMYSSTLRRLERLNTHIHHERRRAGSVTPTGSEFSALNSRKTTSMTGRSVSASHTPDLARRDLGDGSSRAGSLESLRLGNGATDFRGSAGSLPSIGVVSVSDSCSTPPPQRRESGGGLSFSKGTAGGEEGERSSDGQSGAGEDAVVHALVTKCLVDAAARLEVEAGQTHSGDDCD